MSQNAPGWRSRTLSELADFYLSSIHSEFETEDTPHPYPTYQWLVENGYRGLEDGVKQHNITLSEFFTEIVELPSKTESYQWGFENEKTRHEFNNYLESASNRAGLSESTISSKRSRLARYAREFNSIHGHANLVAQAQSGMEEEAFMNTLQVFDVLDSELSTDASKLMYHSEVSQFYKYLIRWWKADYNPVEGVRKEFQWSPDQPDNHGVTAEDVKSLVAVSESVDEVLMVVALAGWGLRPNEVAGLHQSQFNHLSAAGAEEDPYIEFDEERKNGPGTVAVLYGGELVQNRLSELESEDWNGYLFPSSLSSSGHVTTRTIQNWFRELVSRSSIRVGGEEPTPKMCRRFWYQTYLNVVQDVYERLDVIAEEQGSSSAEVVEENYVSEERRRMARREAMRDALSDAFDGVDEVSTVEVGRSV